MTDHQHAFAETLSEAARTGGDTPLGPLGRSLSLVALRELLEHVDGLIEDFDAGVTVFGPTAGDILATAIRAKATTDAANAFLAAPDAA